MKLWMLFCKSTGGRVGTKKAGTAFAQQARRGPYATLLVERYSKAVTRAIFDYKNICVTMSGSSMLWRHICSGGLFHCGV